MDYFYKQKLRNIEPKRVKLEELRNLTRQFDLDMEIKDVFSLDRFGVLSEEIQVDGSSTLLEAFNYVDNEKMDLVDSLKDIEFCGFDDKNNIILKFKTIDDLQVCGVYNFTYEFLDDLFSLGGFYSFSEEKHTFDILSNAIIELFKKFPEEKRQYRFLKYNNDWVLRGVTSTLYRNYDNHLVLYLSWLALHSYAKKTGNRFVVSGGQVSDSDISIFFEDPSPVHVEGVGDVYFGVFVSNGEIRQKRFTFEVTYRIDNGETSFGAMPELEEPLVKVTHKLKVESVKRKIDNIFELDQYKKEMLTYIESLRDIQKLSPDAIHYLFNKIIRSKQKFSDGTKNRVKELKNDKDIINNTLTLIEFLGRINEITTDINERIHLQRIYDNVIRIITKAD